MKVGVLTLPLHTNYGGNLQAYALVTALKEIGYDAWLIKWDKDKIPLWKSPLTIAKRLVLKYLLRKKGVIIGSGIFDRRRREAIEIYSKQFINHRISPQTTGFRSTAALARRIGSYRFDTIVVGSDQVWRPAQNVADYFLCFLEASGSPTRRVAYAASFGTAEWTFSPKQHQVCAHHLRKFDAISVREDSGVSMCRQHFGVQAEHVIDPTMLLTRSHYIDLACNEYSKQLLSGGKGLFAYVLDENADKTSAINYIASSLGLCHFALEMPTKNCATKFDIFAVPPVEDWLRSFEEADFIFTDSFHGCVFSIIFNKPFLAYGNKSRGLSRFESLLSMFHLEDRLINSSAAISSENLHNSIDWPSVNAILATRRVEATSFLIAAITGQANLAESKV